MNIDSVGIEVVAKYQSNNKKWEAPTSEQLTSIKKLILILQKEFSLKDEDLYQHQYIAYKTANEGHGLYPVADTNLNVDPRKALN